MSRLVPRSDAVSSTLCGAGSRRVLETTWRPGHRGRGSTQSTSARRHVHASLAMAEQAMDISKPAPAKKLQIQEPETTASSVAQRKMQYVSRRIPTKVELKTLTHLAKRPAVDIEFQDLTYSVRNTNSRRGRRNILKSISGTFRAGEMTAILGPSGAGKSTLMNILAGYVTVGVMGSIKTNGHPRQMKFFNRLTSYIMQDDLLQPLLTVQEAMEFSANLKLGNELNHGDKMTAIEEVLNTLGLLACRHTRTECLSGGQRKRLSVALELISNPPVIFLDEPTTGLDIVAIKQCLDILKLLARQGRTIICTIHQPSASHFQMFDNVYVVARGQCVYQGATEELVPFLASVGLECPKHYNPADYVMEIIQGEYADNVNLLATEMQNGKVSRNQEPIENGENSRDLGKLTKICRQETMQVMPAVFKHTLMDSKDTNTHFEYPISCFRQFLILMHRNIIQLRRNTIALWIQLLHHLISGVLIGAIFIGVGDDAAKPFSNVKFCMSVLVFFLYTHIMKPVLLLPTEVKILRREYFNRWYGLKAYYMAATIISIPSMLFFGFIFSLVTYLLSSQLLEVSRFLWFFASAIMVGFVSEGLGLIVGSIFSIMNGSIVAPATFSPLLALAVYGMGHGPAIEKTMYILMSLSFLRYGLTGITVSIYGDNRPIMNCIDAELNYCHYQDPELLLRDLGMDGLTTWSQLVALLVFGLIYRTVAYLALRYRLTTEFSNQILNYATKILRHK